MHTNWGLLWLWLWFFVGVAVYILKRAYFLVKGPNPVATTYRQFFECAWIPLLVRAVLDSGIYWLTFYPELLTQALKWTGWNVDLHSAIPHYAVVALFAGLFVDAIVDFLVTKIPYLKDWLPQMPPALTEASSCATKSKGE